MFEESKIWILLFITGALISLGFGAHYLSAVDDANAALQESKSKLQDMQQILFIRQKDWTEKEQAVASIQAEGNKTAQLLKTQETLDERFQKASSELKYLLESMQASVEKIRSSAAGMEVGDITLADARTLRGVKIRKVDESSMSMIHADGTGSISADLLPENLKEKYDLGPNALLPLIQKAHTSLLSGKDAKDAPSATPSSSASAKADAPTLASKQAMEAKIKNLKIKISQLDSQISGYANMASQYQQAASNHQMLASAAQSRGTPSTRHTQNANDNLAQAAAVERQIGALRAEQKKLSIELDHALNSR